MHQPAKPLPERFNFAQHLLRLNADRADKLAYIDDAGSLGYGELDERVRRFAAGLLAMGLRPEERVLLVMHDTVDMPVAFLGAIFAGIVPVPINTLLPAADMAYMISHSRCKAVIVSAPLLETVKEALAQSAAERKGPAPTLVIAGVGGGGMSAKLFSDLLTAAPLALDEAADTRPDDFAFWLYSSGSTGRQKGTVHSHANLYWSAELYGKPILGVTSDDTVFSAAKLFFAYGLGNSLTFPLSVGATVVLMAERPTPPAVFKRLVEYQPTVFCCVPTLYVAMLAWDGKPAREQLAIRRCASAGEALPRQVGERFHQLYGCEILDGLGSTEMTHIFISNRAGNVRYGTSGMAVPGYDVELRDDDNQPVGPGEIGNLYVRGPSAAHLYWANREKSKATFIGEWVNTGDKYTVDADGFYTYSGRSDDMLKVSGQYVSPIEVEGALIEHDAVLECAVIGRTDANGLTKTAAYVVLADPDRASPQLIEELQTHTKSLLAPHKYPREIVFVPDLPKTATGKIQRYKLREQYG